MIAGERKPSGSAPGAGSFAVGTADDAENTFGKLNVLLDLPIKHADQDKISAAIGRVREGCSRLQGARSENFESDPRLGRL